MGLKKSTNTYLEKIRRRRRQQGIRVVCMGLVSCLVAAGVLWQLRLPGITAAELHCGLEEHIHDDSCYSASDALALGCSYDSLGVHVHTQDCYDEGKNLICGYEDRILHTHEARCYDGEGKLICPLPQVEEHTHKDPCFRLQEPEAGQEHVHQDGCYQWVTGQNTICALEETLGHAHDSNCFALFEDPQCGKAEAPAHTHGESCYTVSQEPLCGQTAAEPHAHGESCFTVHDTPQCGETEGEDHSHSEPCYVTCTCGLTETAGHAHSESCYVSRSCGQEETSGHAHIPECYLTLTCTQQEVPEHTHTADCYEKVKGALTCQQQTGPQLICHKEELKFHEHTDSCYHVDPETKAKTLTCAETVLLKHVHSDSCYTAGENALACGLEEHTHTIVCGADLNADLETQETWDALYESLDPTGIWTDDVITAAKFQLGYAPSRDNYQVAEDGVTVSRYTRYGAWAGDPYGPWNTAFLRFVLHYAGIPANVFPSAADAADWVKALDGAGYWRTLETLPEQGDILFFDDDGDGAPDHAALLEEITASDDGVVTLTILEGGGDSPVRRSQRPANALLGYGDLSAAQEYSESNSTGDDEGLNHTVQLFSDATFTTPRSDAVTLTLTGELPEGARVLGYPVKTTLTDLDVLAAYDLSILLEDGTPWQPEEPVTVTFSPEVLEGAAENAILQVWYLPEEGLVEQIEVTRDEQGVSFPASHFSAYALVDVAPLQSIAEPGGDPMIDDAWINYWATQVTPLETQDARLFAASFGLAQPMSLDRTGEQIVSSGGDKTAESGGVYISKTISATETENVFDITLFVSTNTSIETLTKDPDMAVVIVMDISNTMNAAFGGSTRYRAAMDAAEAFLDRFAALNSTKSRVGFVAFNTDAHQIFALSQCDESRVNGLKNTMRTATGNIINAGNYGDSHKRFTNIEGGLKRAYDMIKASGNENKYIIFLSDGFPTTYLQSGYTGWDPYMDGNETKGASGTFYDYVTGYYCLYGTSYSDEAAIRAREMATSIKGDGTKVFSIGIDVGGQTINGHDGRTGLSVIDRTSRSYELGSATDTNAFKNWLRNSIGSGYYYDSTNTAGLLSAYEQIFTEIQRFNQESSYDKWVANDPMPMAGNGGSSFIEFLGFYDHMGMGDYHVYPPTGTLTGSHTENGENTASYDPSAHAIRWDLKNSGYISTGIETQYSYNYQLRYRVRLKNELAGFAEPTVYQTNGKTILTYQEVTTVDGVPAYGDVKELEFPYPSVKGYLGELTFQKVDSSEAHNPVKNAEFTLSHSESCKVCRGDGLSAVALEPMVATSGEDGIVTFTGIPSGHLYDLKETRTPGGFFEDTSTYTVLVSYDQVTVTQYYPNPNPTAEDGSDKFKANVWGDTDDNFPGLALDDKIINHFSYALPNTGGTGTLPYILGGLLLMAGPLKYALDQKKRGRRQSR